MTTPQEARELADQMTLRGRTYAAGLLSLADQVEALTAENAQIRELMNMYNLGGWTDSLTLMQERDKLKEAATKLLDGADWKVGGVLTPQSKRSDFQSSGISTVKTRHLAGLRDAIAKGTAND